MAEDIIRNLRYSKPFIYQIGEKYFYLGAGVCCECDELEKSIFYKYRKALKHIEDIQFNLRKSNVKAVIRYYDEIMKSPKTAYDPSKEILARVRMENLLGTIGKLETEQVIKQYEDMINVLNYKDGTFYRCLNDENKKE